MRDTSRLGAAGGIAFALLYVVAFAIADLPEGGYSDARIVESYADPGARAGIVAGAVLFGVAGLALLPFLANLRVLLRDSRIAADIAFGAGLVYLVALVVAANLLGGYATGVAMGELPEPVDPTIARVLTNQGFALLLLHGLFAAAVLVLATSLAAAHTGAVSRPVAVLGFVVAPLLLFGAAWVPQLLVPMWVFSASVSMARGRRTAPAPSRAPVAA